MLGAPLVQAQPAATAIGQSDFNNEFVAGGFNRGIAADWLPDGRLLVLTQTGQIAAVDPIGGGSTPWIQIADVDHDGENGSLDLVVDRDHAANRFVYVYYKSRSTGRLRIGRFVFNGSPADAGTETVIWANPGPVHSTWGSENHTGGSLTIGPDAKLYLSIGDGFNPPNSQSLQNVFGKVLRLNLDGSVPADNPFFDGPGPNVDEIWAYGFRNPFRASWDMTTGRLWLGDVGGNDAATAYEEANLVTAGANFGWPLCEGPVTGPKNGPTCPAGVTGPVYSYPHEFLGGCCLNASITGGSIIRNGVPELEGDYVYADFARGTVHSLNLSGGTTSEQSQQLFDTDRFVSWIDQGPDGHLYFLSFFFEGNFGELRRLRYTGQLANRAPVIRSTRTKPTGGPAPLDVSFGADAFDPEGQSLTYLWDFGDGSSTSEPEPQHRYDTPGTYNVRLTVSDGQLQATSGEIRIQVGIAPTISLSIPDSADDFEAGDVIVATASANDGDSALANDAYSWTVLFDHDDHQHPFDTANGTEQHSIVVPAEGHTFEGDTGFTISVTVTDQDGLTATASRSVKPNKVPVTIESNVRGGTISVDGITRSTPFLIDTTPGFTHLIDAPAEQSVNDQRSKFASWADTAAPTRTITSAEKPTTYRALFNSTDVGRVSKGLVSLYTFDESDMAVDQGRVTDQTNEGRGVHLKIKRRDRVTYTDSALNFLRNTSAVSQRPATKITRRIAQRDSFTLEAWVDPTELRAGVRRIIAIEHDSRNVTASLGLAKLRSGEVKLATTISTSLTGRSGVVLKTEPVGPSGSGEDLVHIAVTRNKKGSVRVFLNGERVAGWRVKGGLLWGSQHRLSLGSRVDGGQSFLGELHLVAVYDRALRPKAVKRNFRAGPNPEVLRR